MDKKPSPCPISWIKTDLRSYSLVVGAPSPRRFQLPREFTFIISSALLTSKSFPASAFARADGYQRLGSGAPEKPAKYPPGRALPRIAIDCDELQVASIVTGTFD